MPKHPRLNRIKSLHSYTINEAAEVSGVSPRTIRNWAANGLQLMQDHRPALVRGDDLIAFIKGQRKQRKQSLPLDRFYCLRCRTSSAAAGGLAECIEHESRFTLTAICEVCETILRKPVARADLSKLRGMLDLLEAGGGCDLDGFCSETSPDVTLQR